MESKFSKNINSDSEAFYMSCPEVVAKHIANKLSQFKTCVELCCAVGMLSIQLAKKMKKVYAIDIDKQRIEHAKNNAKLYGVTDKINFIIGDVLDYNLLKSVSAEVAILDPDWSQEGSEKHNHVKSIEKTQPDLRKMFTLTKKYITKNIVIRVPKTFTFKTLKDFGPCNIENIIWNNSVKFKVVYFLEDIKKNKEVDVFFNK